MTTQALELLAVLLTDATREWHGFELVDRIGLKSGTLYPLLARFERAGWLRSRWEDVDPHVVGRPRRRLYALTATGELAARDCLDAHLGRVSPAPDDRWASAPEPKLA